MIGFQGVLSNEVLHDGYPGAAALRIDDIRVFGAGSGVTSVRVNGATHADWEQDSSSGVSVNLPIL
jgi:hypothetical protein